MTSNRRAARRRDLPAATVNDIAADLAAGPCVEVWATPGEQPVFSARRNWKTARDDWCREHDLMNGARPDWRRIPKALRDRAPFHEATKE